MGVSVADQAALEQSIANDPDVGDVIKGLKGIRKMRFGFGGRGKRGGGRAVYYVVTTQGAAVMLKAYAKNEMSDLSPGDRRALLALVEEIDNG